MSDSATPAAVQFHAATAQAGKRVLWKEVSLSIKQGEFVALLGPNGVGKTILLKVILGLVPLVAGEVRVFGLAPREARARIGYLPQARAFDPSIRVRGVDLVRLGLDGGQWGVPFPGANLFGSRSGDKARRVREVIELVGAESYADRAIGSLSGGEQQRLLIAQAIVHRPELLLLDEPLASLDYPNQVAVTALVARISNERNMAVVMVTHDVNPILGVAQKLVYVAKQGVVAGTAEQVINGPTLSRIYGSSVEVHYTARGPLLVVGEPGDGQMSVAVPTAEIGQHDTQEPKCCEPRV